MTRAVLISAGGDPILCTFTINLLKKYCWDEFDSLYICYNNSTETPKEIQAQFLNQYLNDEKIKIIYWPTQLGYGLPITKMVQAATEDLILLIEDDGFIFTKGIISKHFEMIEGGEFDALGSPRFSCGQEIAEALRLKYNLDYSGYGDVGPNYWPNFFFCKRQDLLDTDLDFAPVTFKEGIFYPELAHTMKTTESADTFGWASIQLRHSDLKIGDIRQFHASPTEVEDKEGDAGNWIKGDKPFWLHGGSLSTGLGKYLKDVTPDLSHEINIQEFETRCALWLLCADHCNIDFGSFVMDYQTGIFDLMKRGSLNPFRIAKKHDLYSNLIKP